MSARVLCVEGPTLRLVATANGRARMPIILARLATPDTALATEAFNPVASKERGAFLAKVRTVAPDDCGELEPLLEQLAAEVATQAALMAREPPEADSAAETVAPWPDPVAGAALLNEIVHIIRTYVAISRAAAHALALWVLHTAVADCADFTPYIHISSPARGCGKSTLLDVLATLVTRPLRSDSITAAALYRVIDKQRPTVLLDEVDSRLRGEGAEHLRGVLNSGFRRDGCATICVDTADGYEAKSFATYSPKVLAGIGQLWDTVRSRSIPIHLARATPAELRRLRKMVGQTIKAETADVRARVARWAADDRDTLAKNPLPPVPAALNARQGDIWRCLFAIADAAGGRWPARARAAAVTLHGNDDEEGDHGLLLLADLRALLAECGTDWLSSADIVAALTKREDRPWPELVSGKPLTTRGLAKLLGRFGIRPINIREAGSVRKGYRLAQLLPAFARYLTTTDKEGRPAPELSATAATLAPFPPEIERSGSHSARETYRASPSATAPTEGRKDDVADVADNPGRGGPHAPGGQPELDDRQFQIWDEPEIGSDL